LSWWGDSDLSLLRSQAVRIRFYLQEAGSVFDCLAMMLDTTTRRNSLVKYYSSVAVITMVLSAFVGVAEGQSTASAPDLTADPSLVDIPDEPALPRILLIGDSISMDYTVAVRRLLQGRANVHRVPMNGSSTVVGLENLSAWLGDKKWDVIHFNWGLHDLTVLLGQGGLKNDGSHLVPLDQYQKNLEELLGRLKLTGATLVWATTTPVPPADVKILYRRSSDAIAYNAMARNIMEKNGIAIDDLYSFALPRLATIQKPENVHFTETGSEELAKQVAASISAALEARNRH
jgi:hypothetical protein